MATPWYKRLFARFRKISENEPPENVLDDSELEYGNTSTSTRKGKFRFPLIPDDDVPQQKSMPLKKIEKKHEGISDDYHREERRKDRIEIIKERERLFAEKGWLKKAQDVPSPVFGFHPPRNKVEEPVEERNVTNIVDRNEEDHHFANEKDIVIPIAQYPSNTSTFMNDSAMDEEHERKQGTNDEQDLHNIEQIEVHSHPEDDIVQEEIPTVAVKAQIHEQSVKEVKKSKIPYNVFYFGQGQATQYQFPKFQFLQPSPPVTEDDEEWQMQMIELLEQTLKSFNVQAKVVGLTRGPTVTRIELQPAPGVKVNRITNLSDDIKLSLAAKDIRIEAPVPGRSAVGIEIPNRVREPVNIIDILSSAAFQQSKSPMTVALGKDIEGKPVVMDLRKMPHGLIAGATGSGKSVCINSIIISLLYKATPEEVKMILIDPKMVELAPYHDLPHLATPVVTDPKQATMALKWAVEEMDRRYELFAANGVRDIERYNQLLAETNPDIVRPALPYILVIIDELADLMMVAPADVEESIARIAQKARACGIHLLVATQRPSVDVITGMIKANIPTRIAFSVSSQVDSRTILDAVGAERLLGRGDMLLLENGSNKAVRLQGNFVSDDEIEAVCQFVRSQRKPSFLFDKETLIKSVTEDPEDELYHEAVEFVIEQGTASTSLLQRRFRIGYNRAARLIDMMEAQGVISESSGSKPRNVLMSLEEFHSLQES